MYFSISNIWPARIKLNLILLQFRRDTTRIDRLVNEVITVQRKVLVRNEDVTAMKIGQSRIRIVFLRPKTLLESFQFTSCRMEHFVDLER